MRESGHTTEGGRTTSKLSAWTAKDAIGIAARRLARMQHGVRQCIAVRSVSRARLTRTDKVIGLFDHKGKNVTFANCATAATNVIQKASTQRI